MKDEKPTPPVGWEWTGLEGLGCLIGLMGLVGVVVGFVVDEMVIVYILFGAGILGGIVVRIAMMPKEKADKEYEQKLRAWKLREKQRKNRAGQVPAACTLFITSPYSGDTDGVKCSNTQEKWEIGKVFSSKLKEGDICPRCKGTVSEIRRKEIEPPEGYTDRYS